MTVHIIPVGLSLTEFFARATDGERYSDDRLKSVSEQIEEQWEKTRLGLDFDRDDAEKRLIDVFGLNADEESAELSVFQKNAVKLKTRTWAAVPGLSAELDTVRAVAKGPLPSEDLAVLLATDTPNGLAAAVWNAIALAGGEVRHVCYLPEIVPDGGPERFPTVLVRALERQVFVLKIPGLNAQTSEGFRVPMKSMGMLGRLLAGDRRCESLPLIESGEQVLFHLSGGYRATMPYLIALAEWLRTRRVEVSASVVTELGAAPSQVPLRRLKEEWIRDELAVFGRTGKRTDTIPESDILLGYAYERDGSGCALTPFGEGMRMMFQDLVTENRSIQ